MLKETRRMTGTVKWYDEKKGFGFVTPDVEGKDVFLHHTALQPSESEFFITGDRITFTIESKDKGLTALEVRRFEEKKEGVPSLKKEDLNGAAFKNLDLNSDILRAIEDIGYAFPTPIQARAIPVILEGKDLLGCAQTGTGKTAAFALPLLHRLCQSLRCEKKQIRNNRRIKALILSPTRELAIQIGNNFNILGKYTGLKSTVVYGGVGQNPQVNALKRGVDILVATPGRLLDLNRQGHLDLSYIEVLVLDEGDRMLDMGFIHDIRTIVDMVPKINRQTMLFSATIPKEIKQFARAILIDPIEIDISPEQPTLDVIEQAAYIVTKSKKQVLLESLLRDPSMEKTLVFTRTKHGANKVVKSLLRKRFLAETIHGDKSQTARQAALKNFRSGKTRVLVATDVASRGIDVADISHVIQFDLPDTPETYVHRIGRTARAGAKGTALAFCEHDQHKDLKEIEQLIQMRVKIVKNHHHF
ncbi:MAG: DEAD/DEAH box helicase [Candidatus Lokiarchaeota archaeon]|nr:DEAD/DEAH box helicase [Candidatus Lokiarchaeota archaeon]